ncbi:DUF551 domain-containing protein [Desulfobotulus sp.]|uniref:DUF551 domain-containing protein n=1 Tax=Desulfobotulus sp. TaxID=1940337 RepID=UPI002A367887|nr:DUF551 domain-containing protein [Desulfobotulus sp.]MDY0164310.1 hypothetical protein [Desulfobotulus sp.]
MTPKSALICALTLAALILFYYLASIQQRLLLIYEVVRPSVSGTTTGAHVKWIHVNDHMPPVNVPVLVYFLGRCGVAILVPDNVQEGLLIFRGHGGPHNAVTHWMELPMTPPPPVDDD